jgi:NAD(P)H-dependent flavin oxidoreductase YrpB (nitropropane dioxygenase family)
MASSQRERRRCRATTAARQGRAQARSALASTERLGCRYPIVQTAMGWVADPRLVAATGNAGGFGFLAGATIEPAHMEAAILETSASPRSRSG